MVRCFLVLLFMVLLFHISFTASKINGFIIFPISLGKEDFHDCSVVLSFVELIIHQVTICRANISIHLGPKLTFFPKMSSYNMSTEHCSLVTKTSNCWQFSSSRQLLMLSRIFFLKKRHFTR